MVNWTKKKIKKVMLIYPPIKISKYLNRPCFSPLGVLYIASVLKEAGYDVKVLDAVVEDYYHQEKIDNYQLVYESNTTIARNSFGEIKKVKIFSYKT